MKRPRASDFDPKVLDLFDRYVHGMISRREFLDGASRFAVGSMTAAVLLRSLSPDYAHAQQVAEDDARLACATIEYPSPDGSGPMRGLLARPVDAKEKLPGVVVIHENRGLNPHIRDVARRTALAGYVALAPDALTPLGGYPGNDDAGREMQGKLDRDKMTADFVAAVTYLRAHEACTGRVGVVGFCFGGGMASTLAVRIADLAAAVSFYGRQPAAEDVPKIQAPLLLHFAALDQRINEGWPVFEEALKKHEKKYTAYMYPDVNHGFHNDTTPRFDAGAAKLAWERTLEFFDAHLRGEKAQPGKASKG